MKNLLIGLALTTSVCSVTEARDPSPLCSELVWSAQVLAANPDVAESCLGVYEKNGVFYAKSEIEITRVRGNRLTFRALHTNGGKGKPRSVTVPKSWRANIGNGSYRAAELLPGQILTVFIPEDRFALAFDNGGFGNDDELIDIEADGEVTEMPGKQ